MTDGLYHERATLLATSLVSTVARATVRFRRRPCP